jgi:signal transduction histidine kinase
MSWHFPIYTPIFILNIVLSIWISGAVWQRRGIPGIRAFSIVLVASCFWTFTRLLEAGVDAAWAQIFWAKVETFGIVVVSPAWFIFTYCHRYQVKRFARRYILLLSIIPIVTLFLTWTNESHHLIWTSITPSVTDPVVLTYEHGAGFLIAVAYNYVLLSAGFWNLLQAIRTLPEQQHLHAKTLLVGISAPIVGNIFYVLGFSPIQGVDITPFCLTLTALIYYLTVFRFRLYDVRSIARASTIENMQDGVLILNEYNQIVDVNPSVLNLLGLSKPVITKNIETILAHYPAVLAAIINPQPQHLTLPMDIESRYLDIQVSELKNAIDNPAGKLIIFRDVTERRRTEKLAFDNAIEQHRVQLLSQFIRDVSHEFKTPLSVINNSLYLMEKSDDPHQQTKRRQVIQLQTQRLEYLISEMLTTVQLDADINLDFRTVDLNALLEGITHQQMTDFKSKQQRLHLHLCEKPLHIPGDTLMLKKAISSVLENANRYTPDGGTIAVTARCQDEYVIIEIVDSGVGISAESKNRIFERFYRADDSHSTPGFGLGLPIAQSIIDKHQGWIDVQSSPGVGTTFTIGLPRKSDEVLPRPDLELAAP